MLKINDSVVEVKHFPDNTQMLLDFNYNIFNSNHECIISWFYENDEEAITLMYLVKHIKNNINFHFHDYKIGLYMPYIPNARMDRVHKQETEVFTLKYFADFINSLEFNNVAVVDPHSYVSESLINNLRIIQPTVLFKHALGQVNPNCIIYFPDDGAMKRYQDFECFIGYNILYGKKKRDWETGKIKGIDIFTQEGKKISNEDVNGKDIIMFDDIISYGGTLAYSADALKELGAGNIYACVSHTENSILDKEKGTFLQRLDNNIISLLFTTNSIFNKNHPKIKVLEELW